MNSGEEWAPEAFRIDVELHDYDCFIVHSKADRYQSRFGASNWQDVESTAVALVGGCLHLVFPRNTFAGPDGLAVLWPGRHPYL